MAQSADEVCKLRDGHDQRRTEESTGEGEGDVRKQASARTLPVMKPRSKIFSSKYRAKVHTKFVVYFYFLKVIYSLCFIK